MPKKYYNVVTEFDQCKGYGIKIRKQFAKCLSVMKQGQKINPEEFIKEHLDEFTLKKVSYKSNQSLVYHSLSIGVTIGMLEPVSQEELGIAISFDDFCKLKTISYFLDQLKGSQYRNVDPKKQMGTANCYAYRLWNFNTWIHGKSFEFFTEVQQGNNTFKREKRQITINNVEEFLKLYQLPSSIETDFVKVVKMYLLDPIHKNKRASSVKIDRCAIMSYFEKNDSPLNLKFSFDAKYKTTSGEDEQSSMNLSEFMDLLTIGNPNLTQKAMFLCKLHRGLDSATLVDRFNFYAWEQLVSYFGTPDYKTWNLSLCPVPIHLTRMKTGYHHTGFLEKDAIVSIQNYLDYRKKKTSKEMEKGEALFLNERNQPITNSYINISLKKLAKNAGLEKRLDGYYAVRYKINAHECRDLLKSTLLDAGVRPDLADHFIGHKPSDSYEKQAELYPETMRREYSKASKRLNIFSGFSNYVKGFENTAEMKEEITQLQQNQKVMLALLKQENKIP